MPIHQAQSRRSAFTLVELLVVIGIIALLISVLLPALNKARQQANNVYCLSQLRQMGNAIQMYVVKSKGVLPFGYWNGGTLTAANPNQAVGMGIIGAGVPANRADWTILLTQTMSIRSGNTYQEYNLEGGSGSSNTQDKVRFMFVDVDTEAFTAGSPPSEWVHYSAHPRLMPTLEESEHAITKNWGWYPFRKPAKIARIKRAAEVVLIMDATQIRDNGNRAAATAFQIDSHNYDGWPSYQSNYLSSGGGNHLLYDSPYAENGKSIYAGPNINAPTMFENDSGGTIRWRHLGNKSANFLFVDGHCESRRYKSPSQCDLLRRNVNTDLLGVN